MDTPSTTQQTTTETKQEEKKETPVEETPPQEDSLLTNARKLIDEVKKERDLLKKENDRRERLMAEREMEGKGFSGITGTKKTEMTHKDYAEKVLKGEVPNEKPKNTG